VRIAYFVIVTAPALVAWGCAQPLSGIDDSGGGAGGYGGAAASGSGGAGGAAGAGGAGTGGTSSGGAGTGSGGGTTTGSGGGATTGTGGAGGSPQTCGGQQHLCGGFCVGNTPDTGCFGSASCVACPTPTHGTSTCSANGVCDFTCSAGYQKSGNQCTCATQCCSDADCQNGDTCSNGTCQSQNPGGCDSLTCAATCLAQKGCPGACLLGQCLCAC
jgi:hypothetical protein